MLDVHPPHEAAHTWKDFFIHIATIVVGLCIAIGLEQIVEFFHHRHEVRDTREKLHQERLENHRQLGIETAAWRVEVAALKNNMLVCSICRSIPGRRRRNFRARWSGDSSPPSLFTLSGTRHSVTELPR